MNLMFPKPTRRKKQFDKNHLSLLYLEWLRQFPCVVCGNPYVERSHLEAVGTGRNRQRPMREHFMVLPKCVLHHQQYGDWPLEQFEQEHKINLGWTAARMESEFLWQLSNGQLNDILARLTQSSANHKNYKKNNEV